MMDAKRQARSHGSNITTELKALADCRGGYSARSSGTIRDAKHRYRPVSTNRPEAC